MCFLSARVGTGLHLIVLQELLRLNVPIFYKPGDGKYYVVLW